MSLTTAELQALLLRISYKPGWKIQAYDGDWHGQHIAITTVVPDATTFEPLTLDVHSDLPPQADEAAFLRWLGWRLCQIEIHEAREFLRLDGGPVFDPHAPNANRGRDDYAPA